jgi:beta-1,4-N-acetylglucosaminyltransferase
MKKDKKIGLICAHGGHLVEILQLLEAFEGYPHFFITYDEQATLNLNKTYRFVNFAKRPFSLILTVLKLLYVFLKERPTILFSTGAEIAIPPFYLGKFLFHTRLIYLECSAQVHQPSLTGRLVYPITDLFLVQWEPLLRCYGPKAKYAGGLI